MPKGVPVCEGREFLHTHALNITTYNLSSFISRIKWFELIC